MNIPIVIVEYKAPVDGMPTCSHYGDREVRKTGWAEGVSQVVSVILPMVRSHQ
jgi:hypothetical protein